jgi:hypothetical protein
MGYVRVCVCLPCWGPVDFTPKEIQWAFINNQAVSTGA